jgi:hypothetical protein
MTGPRRVECTGLDNLPISGLTIQDAHHGRSRRGVPCRLPHKGFVATAQMGRCPRAMPINVHRDLHNRMTVAIQHRRLESHMNFMKMTLLLPLFLLLSFSMFGQSPSLTMGAVVFSLPVREAFQFTLMSGGYFGQGLDLSQSLAPDPAHLNGFNYANGTFHLWKNGGPGVCQIGSDPNIPGCRFDGTMGKLVTIPLDKDCAEISFPITDGILQILTGNGVRELDNLNALYSQTFCGINGSFFMAGGTLVVQTN